MTRDVTIDVVWQGVPEMLDALDEFERRVNQAIEQVAAYFAPIFEAYAKTNARWTDRTGNARQTLNADWQRISAETVVLWLAHGVEYGIYLEKRWAGRYAIIWPTIEAHLVEIQRMLQRIFA